MRAPEQQRAGCFPLLIFVGLVTYACSDLQIAPLPPRTVPHGRLGCWELVQFQAGGRPGGLVCKPFKENVERLAAAVPGPSFSGCEVLPVFSGDLIYGWSCLEYQKAATDGIADSDRALMAKHKDAGPGAVERKDGGAEAPDPGGLP